MNSLVTLIDERRDLKKRGWSALDFVPSFKPPTQSGMTFWHESLAASPEGLSKKAWLN
jgi:hypothetical protein